MAVSLLHPSLYSILLARCHAHECWQCHYVITETAGLACATLWRWPDGRLRVRLVTLGQVRESRRLRGAWEVGAFLGMPAAGGAPEQYRWQRIG